MQPMALDGGSGGGINPPAGDLNGTVQSPEVVSTHLAVTNLGMISGNVNFDPTNNRVYVAGQTGNLTCTLTGTDLVVGTAYSLTLYIQQDATGGHTLAVSANIAWNGSTVVPTFNLAAHAVNVLTMETVDGGASWEGSLAQQLPAWPLSTALGGTGTNSPAVNTLLAGGAAAGTPLQPVNSSGTAGNVLTDNGAGALPTFQPAAAAGLAVVGTTGLAGYTLVNGTGTIFTWTAPNDGAMHRVEFFGEVLITVATEVGGAISVAFEDPVGASHTNTLISGNQTTGVKSPSFSTLLVAPGAAVTITQSTALTAGTAVLWLEMWAL